MPVCQGRNWPNGPRTHQGGSIGRSWPWVIALELPPCYVAPYDFGILELWPIAPASWSYGQPEWRPLTQPTDWWWALYHYLELPNYPAPWGWYLEWYHYPTGGWGYFGSSFFYEVPYLGVLPFGGQSPADYFFHFLDTAVASPVPYSALPANFCTGT